MGSAYSDYVRHLSYEWPGLASLSAFLKSHEESEIERLGDHIVCLEFDEDRATRLSKLRSDILADGILDFVAKRKAPNTVGMCVLVEDIVPETVEVLGGILDIDPHFFSGYIERGFVEIERNPPSPLMTSLPSYIRSQSFANFHYQRPIDLGEYDAHSNIPYELCLQGKLVRPGRCLPSLFGKHIGLIRSCFSILHKRLDESRWICLMLMDSLSANVIDISAARNGPQGASFQIRQVPYRIKRSSLSKMQTFSEFCKAPSVRSASSISMLDEVVALLQGHIKASTSLPTTYDISFLAIGPIRLIIDEWLTYSLIMGRYVKAYEYSIKRVQQRFNNFESEDIVDLYRWRRRSQQSLHKLQTLKWFIEASSNPTQNQRGDTPIFEGVTLVRDMTRDMTRDIIQVMKQIEQNGNILEAMIPIMTSIIQLLDSRRSTIEAIYIKRLTYIALIFMPLSFVATLFSMSEPFSIAGNGFLIYIAAAFPLLLVVLAAAILPISSILATLKLACRGRDAATA
ncbi:hypothetical protein M434DRAFT_33012 [Hypoxylon sp. CO27-5]|nr:hypothetical protein M434DRAFT_33012 [Hypoxylon sp. CO27-5]